MDNVQIQIIETLTAVSISVTESPVSVKITVIDGSVSNASVKAALAEDIVSEDSFLVSSPLLTWIVKTKDEIKTLLGVGSSGGSWGTITGDLEDQEDLVEALSNKVDEATGMSLVADTEISKIHSQGTDQGLDTGGTNAVTAAQAKAGYSHSQVTHAPSDAVALSTVKADTDIADALNKRHASGSDNETAISIINLGIDEIEFALIKSYMI